MRIVKLLISALGAMALGQAAASAQDTPYYIKGSAGFVKLGDSSNSGRARAPFEPGLIDAVLVEGGAYTFDTEFETGGFAAIALGKTTPFGPFRSEIELIGTRTGVKRHGNFRTLGTDLADVDAAVLLGGDTPVGTNTGLVLRDGRGEVDTLSAMINFYQDIIVPAGNVRPYWGFGVGPTWVNVDYSPSGIGLVDDDFLVLGYQVMGGFAYDMNEQNALVSGLRYRGTMRPVEVDTDAILTSEIDVDVDQVVFELGWQHRF